MEGLGVLAAVAEAEEAEPAVVALFPDSSEAREGRALLAAARVGMVAREGEVIAAEIAATLATVEAGLALGSL